MRNSSHGRRSLHSDETVPVSLVLSTLCCHCVVVIVIVVVVATV